MFPKIIKEQLMSPRLTLLSEITSHPRELT